MSQYTPMITHYLEIKKSYPDTLIFYRLGDFYEMFFDDAKTASHELNLVLTGRNAGVEEKVPMCGVPYHAVSSYLQRLIARGYKVAIVEQLEDPAEAVGLVKRDVIRVVTPGTAIDEVFDEKRSSYLASLCDFDYGYALALCEITTGETKLLLLDHDTVTLKQNLLSHDVRELVIPSNCRVLKDFDAITCSVCDETELNGRYSELYKDIEDVHLQTAIGRLLNYLEITQKRSMQHLLPFELEENSSYLQMDYSTIQNLELVEPNRLTGQSITLWSFLDKSRSAAGSRQLKKWIQRPLRSLSEINKRQSFIEFLNKNALKREKLKENLSELYDIERLIARVGYGNANGKDCVRLQKSLQVAPAIMQIVKESKVYPEYENTDCCESLCDLLNDSLVEDPPLLISVGGIFRDGYNEQLDEYRRIQRSGQSWIAELERQEKERTGIKTLKVGYNKVFGYYIEVSKGQVPLIKEEWGYQRKQTLTTGERYITEELKEKEDTILHAEERAIRLERELFEQLIATIKEYLPKLQKLANVLSAVDANYALAVVSNNNRYVKPVFTNDGILDVKQGRHPILETVIKEPYIPNDINITPQQPIQIITGPNMGGKSTYMRQCALLVIMAQIGCYVPARSAVMPIFDHIFTRIGSTDDILAGQSTFMVEMSEANTALQNATKDSLIIFDEIGRGTSTYDGMALAQSMLEYIDAAIGAKTLFSTHYHELTSLENNMSGVKNKHVDVHEENDRVTFLYKVKDGKANRSYGIHVASLAKLPDSVIERAKDLLKEFENSKKHHNDQSQIIMMEKVPKNLQEIETVLKNTNPDNMTPIEALQLVASLKKKTEEK
ncbi:MAG: DNA mismatch repair protein MutS [Erysipelotrichaceae bacterium]|nr:DNA mismatch repair protein MutS [Erysipelotrichaceae bacterium]